MYDLVAMFGIRDHYLCRQPVHAGRMRFGCTTAVLPSEPQSTWCMYLRGVLGPIMQKDEFESSANLAIWNLASSSKCRKRKYMGAHMCMCIFYAYINVRIYLCMSSHAYEHIHPDPVPVQPRTSCPRS